MLPPPRRARARSLCSTFKPCARALYVSTYHSLYYSSASPEHHLNAPMPCFIFMHIPNAPSLPGLFHKRSRRHMFTHMCGRLRLHVIRTVHTCRCHTDCTCTSVSGLAGAVSVGCDAGTAAVLLLPANFAAVQDVASQDWSLLRVNPPARPPRLDGMFIFPPNPPISANPARACMDFLSTRFFCSRFSTLNL